MHIFGFIHIQQSFFLLMNCMSAPNLNFCVTFTRWTILHSYNIFSNQSYDQYVLNK